MNYILVSACLLGVSCRFDGQQKAKTPVQELIGHEDFCLIPVCPEQWGGLPIPREPSERRGDKVVSRSGKDVSWNYRHGSEQVLGLAKLYGCKGAILKERSPSCGTGEIYDGTFTKTLIPGDGTTAELLKQHGISIVGESFVKEHGLEGVRAWIKGLEPMYGSVQEL